MKIKKYTAPTMPEAMQQIRKELGSDAVILNSKEVSQKRWLGFFRKKQIEVFAALDPSPLPAKGREQSFDQPRGLSNIYQQVQHQDLLAEIKHLKQVFFSSNGYKSDYPPIIALLDHHLQAHDINAELITSIIEDVMQQDIDETDEQMVYEAALQTIRTLLKNKIQTGSIAHNQVIHFIGPTGVGKTTTLAKTAARAMLKDGKQVAFITVDTYRIAAIEQLKTYARILKVPIKVAYDINEYRDAIEAFREYDFIFVDTPGRNFQSEQYVNALKASIDFDDDSTTYLVMSLTAKSHDMNKVHEQFKHLPLNGLIMTKLDETSVYGGLLNITLPYELDIVSVTNGQNVPDDMFEPAPEYIANLIMGGFNNG